MLTVSHHNDRAGYSDYPTVFATADLYQDDFFRRNLKTSYGSRPTTTSKSSRTNPRLGSSSGFCRINTAGVPGTPSSGALCRPMTAVRGVGFTSANRSNEGSTSPLEIKYEDTPEQKVKEYESRIMSLLEESVKAAHVKNTKIALKRAEEAASQERSLILFEDRAELSETHNLSLTFAVIHNLAQQYANENLYQEAITEYKKIIENRKFGETARLKMNVGNIYVKMGKLNQAMRMYQMAFDGTPLAQKYTRRKIVHNIGILLVQMGKLNEAAQKFEWVMQEKPDFEAGMHLILCHFALFHIDGMKRGFLELLDIPLSTNTDDEYGTVTDDIAVNIFNDTIKNDELSKYEHELRLKAEKTILNAANLIAPVINETLAEGFAWCVEAIKSSPYSALAFTLEINKAMVYLHNGQVQTAIQSLKDFKYQDVNGNSSASTVLSFINFLRQDYKAAEKCAEIAKSIDRSNTAAYVNLSACSIVKNELASAENLLLSALKYEPNHVQGLYNLGLVYKRKDMFQEALDCFTKLTGISHNDPLTFYQMGHTCQLLGDIEQADKWYNQLLALIPLDPGVFKKLGEMYDSISDKHQAYHYYKESHRAYPANFDVIYWLCSYCMSMKNFEKALEYSLKAIELTPNQPEWRLVFADCLKKSGDIHEALAEYEDIYEQYPNNVECLKSLYKLRRDLGYKDAKKYAQQLENLVKMNNSGEHVGSGKICLSRCSSTILSGSGKSIIYGKRTCPVYNEDFVGDNKSNRSLSRLNTSNFMMESSFYEINVADSFGSLLARPMTAVGKRDDDFGNEELGIELLPE